MGADRGWRRWSGTLVAREPRVERWFLRSLLAPHGRRERLLLRALDGTPAAAAALLRSVPGEEEREAEAALEAALAVVRRGANEELLDGGGWVLVGPRSPSPRRLVALGFGRGEPAPRYVLKASWAAAPFAAEAASLRRLRPALPERLALTLPAVVGHWPGEPEVLATSALAGRSAYVELRRTPTPERLAAAQVQAAAAWLAGFQAHAPAATPRAWEPSGWQELAPGPLRDRPEPAWLGALRRRLAAGPLPVVTCHGDFWARNVLFGESGEVAGVVDWESSRDGQPLADIMHFLFSHAQLLGQRRHRGPVESFRDAFVTETPLAAAARAATAAMPFGEDPELRLAALGLHLLDGAAGRIPGAAELPREEWLACFSLLEEARACAFSG